MKIILFSLINASVAIGNTRLINQHALHVLIKNQGMPHGLASKLCTVPLELRNLIYFLLPTKTHASRLTSMGVTATYCSGTWFAISILVTGWAIMGLWMFGKTWGDDTLFRDCLGGRPKIIASSKLLWYTLFIILKIGLSLAKSFMSHSNLRCVKVIIHCHEVISKTLWIT